jgi:hypothetical protein
MRNFLFFNESTVSYIVEHEFVMGIMYVKTETVGESDGIVFCGDMIFTTRFMFM